MAKYTLSNLQYFVLEKQFNVTISGHCFYSSWESGKKEQFLDMGFLFEELLSVAVRA